MTKDKIYRGVIIASEICALLLPVILYCLLNYKVGLFYETNDDINITNILSGIFTGKPEFHTLYNSVLITIPLALMYRITDVIPWYGILIMVIRCVSISFPLMAVFSKSKSLIIRLLLGITVSLFFFSFLVLNGSIQYTSTAIIAAMSGFACLCLHENRKAGRLFFAILEFFAYCLRPESMEIIQPIGVMLLVGMVAFDFLCTREKMILSDIVKVILQRIFIPAAISLLILLVGTVSYKLAYSGPMWKDAVSENSARMSFFDYSIPPEYNDIKGILSDCNVSKEEYEAYCSYLNYGWNNESETVEKVAAFVDERKEPAPSLKEIVRWVFVDSYSSWKWGINKLLYVMLIVEVVVSIFAKAPQALITNILYEIAKIVCWGYIFFKGRMPDRVMLPLQLTEIAIVLIIIIKMLFRDTYKKYTKIVLSVFAGLGMTIFLYYGLKSAQEQYWLLSRDKAGKEIMCDVQSEIAEYCNMQREDSFIISPTLTMYMMASPLREYEKNDNFVYGGGWFGALPTYRDYTTNYIDNGEELFLLLPENDEIFENSLIHQRNYLEWKYGNELEHVDSFALSTGGMVEVYKVKRNIKTKMEIE